MKRKNKCQRKMIKRKKDTVLEKEKYDKKRKRKFCSRKTDSRFTTFTNKRKKKMTL